MRLVTALLLAFLFGPAAPAGAQPAERIELRWSEEPLIEVEIDGQGEGHYRLSAFQRRTRTGTFRLTAQLYADLVARLAVYRREAMPASEASARGLRSCPVGVPLTRDAGGVLVRWRAPDVDVYYFADFGCDRERNAARNADIWGIVSSLPVPDHL